MAFFIKKMILSQILPDFEVYHLHNCSATETGWREIEEIEVLHYLSGQQQEHGYDIKNADVDDELPCVVN